MQWLTETLLDLISPAQSSFIVGRQIKDNVAIMREIIHTMRHKKGNRGATAIKIDLEKTHDRLS